MRLKEMIYRLAFILVFLAMAACAPESTLPPGDTTAPMGSITLPTDGATLVSVNTTVVVEFSEAMAQTATEGAFSVSPTVTGAFSWSIESMELTFTPAVPLAFATGYTVTVGTGATDISGNFLSAALSAGFTTEVPDTTAPTGSIAVPADGAGGVNVNTAVVVAFSEAMAQTATEGAFSVSPTVTGAFSWSIDSTELTFTPAAPLAFATGYTVTVGTGAADISGNLLAAPISAGFTTTATQDATAPVGSITLPTDGAAAVGANTTVVVTFSEAMGQTATEGAFSISPVVSGTFSWSIDSTELTFIPAAPLAYGTAYTVTVGTGATDISGNPLATALSGGFTTAACGDLVGGRTVCASWDQVQAQILGGRGGCTGCHTGTSPSAGLSWEADQYTRIVTNGLLSGKGNGLKIVEPGVSADSFVYRKITGNLTGTEGSQMPLGGSPLSQADIDLIAAWIDEGALESEL